MNQQPYCLTQRRAEARRWVAVLLMVGLLGAFSAVVAQPTAVNPSVVWEHEAPLLPNQLLAPFIPERDFNQLLRLSPTRYVQVGTGGYYQDANSPPNLLYEAAHLLFFDQNGDTLANRTVFEVFPRITHLQDAIVDPAGDGSFLTFAYKGDSISWSIILLHFDSLGSLQWEKRIRTPGYIPYWGTGRAIPDGYLLPYCPILQNTLGGVNSGRAGILKLDRQGRAQWSFGHPTYSAFGRFALAENYVRGVQIAACQDGSYAFTYQDLDRYPPPGNTLFDRDNHLLRFTARGDTLASAHFGAPDWQDIGYYTAPTPDGGFLVSGARRPRFPIGGYGPMQGYVFQLDSTLAVQWEKRLPLSAGAGQGSELVHAQTLANGHVRVMGYAELGPTVPAYRLHGLVAELAPPAGTGLPADSATVVTQWLYPNAWPDQVLPDSAGNAIIGGAGQASYRSSVADHRYRGKWTGLGRPAPYDLCAYPPRLAPAAATLSGPGGAGADEFTFALDSLLTYPGPRYGIVSLVRWTYSDGAPADTGWTVRRVFATPLPVRVTCTVVNNLGCKVATELYPFGPCPCPLGAGPTLPAAPAVEVYPNPAVGGRFALRGATGALLTVTDALGRVVRQQPAQAAEKTLLDLSPWPLGVYALRVTWPDGRTRTLRLVRW